MVILSIYIFERFRILFISSIYRSSLLITDSFDTIDTFCINRSHRHLKDSIHVNSIMDGMEEVMFCRYTERGLLSTPHLLSCFMALSEDLDIVKWFIQLVPFYFHTNCAATKQVLCLQSFNLFSVHFWQMIPLTTMILLMDEGS